MDENGKRVSVETVNAQLEALVEEYKRKRAFAQAKAVETAIRRIGILPRE